MYRLIAALTLAATLSVRTEEDRGRPVVLLVHGRGMNDRDTAATRKAWFDALAQDGKANGSRQPVTERDVRAVWYADVLDPRSSAGCDYAPNDARARRSGAV